jgi:hypothetical protein
MYMSRYRRPNTRRHKLVPLPKLHDALAVPVINTILLDTQHPDRFRMIVAYSSFAPVSLSLSSCVDPFFCFWNFFVRIWAPRPNRLPFPLSVIVPTVMILSMIVTMTMSSASTPAPAHRFRASVVATIIIAATVITRALV